MTKKTDIEASLWNALGLAAENGYTRADIQDMVDTFFKDIEPKKEERRMLVAAGDHGTCGWEIDNKGTLRIYPDDRNHGTLEKQGNFMYTSPWEHHNSFINKVVVEQGVSAHSESDYLFAGLRHCKEFDLSGLDMSNAETVDAMFKGCIALEKIDLGNLNFSNIISTFAMFSDCKSLKEVNFGNVDTSNLHNASQMFERCFELKELDLSKQSLANLESAEYMFYACENLEKINLNFRSKGTNKINCFKVFEDCDKLANKDEIIKSLEGTQRMWIPPKQNEYIKTIEQHGNRNIGVIEH